MEPQNLGVSVKERTTKREERSNENNNIPVKKVEGEEVEDRLTDAVVENILPARYLEKDENGDIEEDPEELFERVARNVAEPDEGDTWEEYYDMMANLEFMPNSPTLMNAGGELQQLSACFVLEPKDDLESIFEEVKNAAKVFQSGGGVGYPFHHLRPYNDPVSSTGGVSSGPVSFMKAFDQMCNTIKQGGKRRGAQMAIMRSDHPDILRFATAKRIEGELSNFNISVGITENFMDAVKNDETYAPINPRTGEPHEVTEGTAEFYSSDPDKYPEASGLESDTLNFWRDIVDNGGDEEFKEFVEEYREDMKDIEPGEEMEIPARLVWNVLVDGAYQNGEPGLFMYDRANEMHSIDVDKHPEHRIEATNPCGEQPLTNYESCNLGHINLSLLVEGNGDGQALRWEDWEKESEYNNLEDSVTEYLDRALENDRLEEIAKKGTRFLDNVVTQSDFPLEEIEEKVESMRKIGLGLMGFSQMLTQMGIEYGSEESLKVAEEVQRRITRYAVEESHELAEERGTFDLWEKSKWSSPEEYSDWFEKFTGGLDPEEYSDGLKVRNHNMTTVAPTGTTSLIGDTSAGCEPPYEIASFKYCGGDIGRFFHYDSLFLETLENKGEDVEQIKEDVERLAEEGEWNGIESLPYEVLSEKEKQYFVTSNDVSPEEHVRMQAAFQSYNHSAISKTCNLPGSSSREDIQSIYRLAHDNDLKGITVYVDNTRDEQVYNTQENKSDSEDAPADASEEQIVCTDCD